ncbi:ribonuclease Z [Faecalibacterium sp. An58]|uniref:ribonuclease Z n=1 Tax=Faecalibacterium sp. An58 TaxID=1965648 RepID=UPI000B39BB46|nr:ribonuclease Z [Faecalibacterium sp. An58]OUN72924.1 ribonuclease Z [Faecalibacterium sp. An58]
MVTVTLLGTAATMPLPQRALTAALLSWQGHSLLFDCGEGTQAAAMRAGVGLSRLEAICLTHYHGDHVFGLPGLLQTIGCQGRTRPLLLTGPRGLEQFWSVMRVLAGPLPYQVLPAEMGSDGLWFEGGAEVRAIPTRHRVPSQGYQFLLPRAGRFDPARARALGVPLKYWKQLQQGKAVQLPGGPVVPQQVCGPVRRGIKVVFSGDTAPCPALEAAARDADLLICDATYAEDELASEAARYGHSTFRQSAELAVRAGVRRLWLAHYSPRIEDPEAFLPLVQSICPAAECGLDGKSITLRFEEAEP